MRVAVHKTVTRSPAVRPAAVAHVQPAAQATHESDPAEREAEATARNVIRMPLPASAVARAQRNAASGPGAPLPPNVRAFMEPRFRADFSAVRIHAGPQAAQLNRQINARAFTVGQHIHFGEGRFRPETEEGRELIAHELTHTLQQDAGPVRVQRLGLDDVLDGLAELAANVPGFTLLTLIIGRNPINLRVVERNAANLMRGFMGLVPGGEVLFQVLERYGVVRRLGEWIGQRTEALGLTFASIRDSFTRFTDALGWRDIFSPGDVWRRAEAIFSPYLARVRDLAVGLVTQAIRWLKETFMQPLADFAREIPGYSLVTVQLGRDPFTNSRVARTAMNVVRAVAEFIPSGREKVDQLAQSGALERAYRWFMEETRARNLTWERISGTFTEAWNALRLEDVLHPIDTLRRMVSLFRPLLADLAGFARAGLMKLAEFIFEAAMGAGGARIVAIFRRARDTFNVIIADPVRFLRNLLGAVGQGVRQFMNNVLVHLREGVIAWLTGPVAAAGVQMPERWDLRGIIWFVLQILGITWVRVRQKLVRLMGERPVALLEAGFQLVQEIRERGLVQALRERVTEFFGTLRDAALGAIRSFIQQRLVMAGIQLLLSMLSPVGAVIQAIIKTYTTIQFFLQRINQILELVESIVNSIASIAAGVIAAAANFIERTMARTIPLILDFLARFIGLGDVAGQVQTTIRNLQARVDQMLDRAVDWIRRQAASLASRALGGDPNAPSGERVQRGLAEAVEVVNRYAGRPIGSLVLRPLLAPIKLRHRLRVLDVIARGNIWVVDAAASPGLTQPTTAQVAPTTLRTQVAYTPGSSTDKSTEVYAYPLTYLEGTAATARGSAANRNNPLFPRAWPLVTNESAPKQAWRRMHLLSAELHGPGNIEANIVPAVERINSRMRDGPERWGKDEVIAKTHNVGWYRVRVAYNHPAPHDEFPSSVSVRGGLCAVDPSNPASVTPGPEESAASFADSSLGTPNMPGATVGGPPSIQGSTSRALFAGFRDDGVTQYLAQWLAGQAFGNPAAVIAAMTTSTDPRVSSKTAVVSALMQGPNPRLVP